MADEDETPDVDVDTTTVEAPDAVVEASPTIVVESGDDGDDTDAQDVERAVDTEHRLTVVETGLGDVVAALGEVTARLDGLTAVQDAVVDEVAETAEDVEAVGEAVAEDFAEDHPEDAGQDDGGMFEQDEAPTSARKHWFFRSRADFRNN